MFATSREIRPVRRWSSSCSSRRSCCCSSSGSCSSELRSTTIKPLQAAVSRTLPDPVGTTEARVTAAAANLNLSQLDVTVDPYDPNTGTHSWAQGGDVTVTGKYPYSISLLGFVVKSGQLTSQTTERVE
jgi:hypothetical protein